MPILLNESLNIPQATTVVHKVSGHTGVITTALGEGWHKVLFYNNRGVIDINLSSKKYHYSVLNVVSNQSTD